MKKKICAVIILMFTLTSLMAQRSALMLQKRNRNKIVYYYEGEEITYYLEGKKKKIQAVITGFRDSAIVLNGVAIDLNQIRALHIDEKTRWWIRYKYSQVLLIGGVWYPALDIINNGESSKETIAISSAAVGAGLIAKLLIPNRINIRGRTRLRIIEFK